MSENSKNEPWNVSRRSARSRGSETLPDAALRLSPNQKLALAIAGVLLILQAAGIYAQLVVLSDSNDRIHAQDAKIGDLRKQVDPILDAVGPLAQDARPLVRSARGLSQPLAQTLEDVEAAAEEAPPLARAGRTLVGESLPLVRALREFLPAAAAAMPELRALMPEVRALLPKAASFLDEAQRRATLARADAAVSATLHLEHLQKRQLGTALTQLRIQRRTLAIQEQALAHIESIDRRTGGELDGPP